MEKDRKEGPNRIVEFVSVNDTVYRISDALTLKEIIEYLRSKGKKVAFLAVDDKFIPGGINEYIQKD